MAIACTTANANRRGGGNLKSKEVIHKELGPMSAFPKKRLLERGKRGKGVWHTVLYVATGDWFS